MADTTTNLAMPYLTASQAQKHVTHNEALDIIDEKVGAGWTAHGAGLAMVTVEDELTLSGASVSTAVAFPNQCVIVGASVRVTQAITGAPSFQVGDGTSATRYVSALSVSLGATSRGTIGPVGNYTSTPVIITPTSGSFTGGKARVALHYLLITPPSS